MKYVIAVCLVILFSCSKKECKTCTSYVLSPVVGTNNVEHDTIYSGTEYCGQALKDAQAQYGKYYEIRVGTTTYRYTTIVDCRK